MRRAVFLHIQKTAGTAIQDMARRAYGSENVVSHGDFLTLGVAGLEPFAFASGHFGIEFARPLMKDRYSFTFLRDPIDRLISFYAFCSAQKTDTWEIFRVARRMRFEDFLSLGAWEPYRRNIWNNQVWQLAFGNGLNRSSLEFSESELLDRAKRNLEAFDYVGFLQTINDDIDRIFRALGFNVFALQKINTSNSAELKASLSPTAIEKIHQNTRLDQELYQYAWERYRGTKTVAASAPSARSISGAAASELPPRLQCG